MMSIFGTPFCAPVNMAPQPSFMPLFRLLDELDSYAAAQESPRHQRQHPRQRQGETFRPSFDARETADAYELHGELPGIERENLDLHFTGPQTLVVRGRIVRTYGKKNPENETPQEQQQEKEKEAPQPEPETEKAPVVNNHHATVEDDLEDDDSLSIISGTSAAAAAPAPTPAETPKTEVAKPAPTPTPTPTPAPKQAEKVLLHERVVGGFSRTFEFPGRIDRDAVTATLDAGVLTIVVPKAKKVEVRRIVIY